ncbi:MAG: M28 family peptidase, partial [Ramlibacter sp.]
MPIRRSRRLSALPALVLSTLCLSVSLGAAAAGAPGAGKAVVREAPLRAHLSFLADDLLEGRGTGQRGGEITVRYLETQAAAIGLQPAAGKEYRQKVDLVGQKTQPGSSLRFEAGGKTIDAAFGTDVVYANAGGQTDTRLDAPMVFVGYGIDAPSEGWNDFQGFDAKGKLLVAMV